MNRPTPERLRQALPVFAGLVLFLVALEVLRVELRSVGWDDLRAELLALPRGQLTLAILLTIVNYVVLTGYDLVAFVYIGKRLPRLKVALASFLAYAVANTVGFAMLSGASVRYRFYSRWGVTGEELSRIVFSYSVTFWLGLFALGGLSLAVAPLAGIPGLPAHQVVVPVGWGLVLTPVAYVVLTTVRQRPVRLWSLELPIPLPRIAAAQLILSSIDWALAGAVLFVLLPSSALTFLQFLALFFIAILLGLASHVPGGIGVFETLMVLLLKPYLTSGQVLPALVVYRVVYYLVPLAVALAVLLADEARQRRTHAARVGALLGRVTEQVTPRVLAALTFLAGVVLLLSGATPAGEGRLARLDRILPLGVIEVSHFLGSVAGAALLLLSQGLSRRLDVAYYLASGLIVVGITASLLKWFDY
jgi:phosphatidylglycerol lysyltransferase